MEERQQLCFDRLTELAAELPEGFWSDCVRLSLGEKKTDEWLDYQVCGREFGTRLGAYVCLLYAQVWLVFAGGFTDRTTDGNESADASASRPEVVCVTRELLLLVYGQMADGAAAEDIRDSLYWFYMDYSSLLVQYAAKAKPADAVFGGALFVWPAALCGDGLRAMHTWDCGLFLGNRYAARLLSAVDGLSEGRQEFCGLIAGADAKEAAEGGFLLTEHQKEVFVKLQESF